MEPCHHPHHKAWARALWANSRVITFSVEVLSSLPAKVSHLFLELPRTQGGASTLLQQPLTASIITRWWWWGGIFPFSSSQIHLKYFGSFILYPFTIQPFQVRKTETQICNLHTSYSLDVCVWPHLRDLEPRYSSLQLSTRNSCEPEIADFHTLLFAYWSTHVTLFSPAVVKHHTVSTTMH